MTITRDNVTINKIFRNDGTEVIIKVETKLATHRVSVFSKIKNSAKFVGHDLENCMASRMLPFKEQAERVTKMNLQLVSQEEIDEAVAIHIEALKNEISKYLTLHV